MVGAAWILALPLKEREARHLAERRLHPVARLARALKVGARAYFGCRLLALFVENKMLVN